MYLCYFILAGGEGIVIETVLCSLLSGLLCSIKERLQEENPLISGDSAGPEMQKKMDEFCQKLDQLISAQVPFTVILDDPAGILTSRLVTHPLLLLVSLVLLK